MTIETFEKAAIIKKRIDSLERSGNCIISEYINSDNPLFQNVVAEFIHRVNEVVQTEREKLYKELESL